ncbi:Fructosamine kinase-domain-containing protein [Xylariales sp. PMI_506]|nr:Fructosamine kinase-domain-containing protein [Xylariales sp. PMI_506]
MVYIDPEFTPAVLREEDKYEGTDLDENVLAALPNGAKIVWVATYSASFWATSTKVDTELDGVPQSYFLKVYSHEHAEKMAIGEFEGSKALYKALPENVPKPVAAGTCARDPKKAFYLAEFRDISDEMPEANEFVAVVAKLHQESESPNGKFGFHVPTYGGDNECSTDWCDTWEEFFTRIMTETMDRELRIQGPNEELAKLRPIFLEKVIPRLIRPMETNGRRIKPSLVHGDLWHGNVGIDNETDEPILFDPCAFYGHHEFDFSLWRAARYRTNRPHVRAYHKIAEMSEPVEEQDDRHAMYAIRADFLVSSCWPSHKGVRQLYGD